MMIRNGSIREAHEIIESIDDGSLPEVGLYRGYCHIHRWESELAIPHLRGYIESRALDYPTLVAKVNLASCLVTSARLDEAMVVIDELIKETEARRLGRLLGNALELRGQVHLQSRDLQACAADLDRAIGILSGEKSSDQLFVLKWKAILDGIAQHDPRPIEKFREIARQRLHWESVRDCDFQILKLAFDPTLFNRLYFGTPYDSFRDRLEREFGSASLSAQFVLGDTREGGPRLDLASGVWTGTSVAMKPGGKPHQLMQIVLRDLYKPASIGAIFGDLFAGEYFDAFSSQNRVHQTIYRARELFEENGIPFEIRECNARYHFVSKGGGAVVLTNERAIGDTTAIVCGKILELFGAQRFTSEEARKALGMSKSAFHRFSEKALATNRLRRFGKTRSSSYEINAF